MHTAEIERFLSVFTDLEKVRAAAVTSRQYNLEQMCALLDLLGHPERSIHSIHIAGTDGKGSIAAMLHHLLSRSGKKVGLYTSPHLESVTERIVIGSDSLSADTFAAYLRRVAALLGVSFDDTLAHGRLITTGRPASTPVRHGYATVFEMLTAAAFLAFADHQVDVAVVEVGLGGRLDCTNVICPLVAVINSIDYDHMERLGPSLLTIAREKLGIVKPGVPVVLGCQYHQEVLEFARKYLADHTAQVESVADEWTWNITHRTQDGYHATVRRWSDRESRAIRVGLLGDHQVANAVTALATINLLPENLRAGVQADDLATVRWPGRFELVTQQNGVDPIVLDGAHTPQAAFALRQTLDQLFPGPRAFVLAQLEDKQTGRFAEHLIRPVDTVITTTTESPRSKTPLRLAAEIRAAVAAAYPGGNSTVLPATDVAMALHKAVATAPTATLVVTGSIYAVGEARKVLRHASFGDLTAM